MAKAAPKTHVFSGQVNVWEAFDHKRSYGTVTVPFNIAHEFVVPVRYNALSGKGEQRDITDSHCKKLENEIVNGTFTPCPVSAGLRKKQQENLVSEDGQFELTVDTGDPLPQTDGGHRFESITRLIKKWKDKLNDTTNAEEKVKITRWLEQLNTTPITITIYFDGDAQEDFINLQAGRTVDAAHMLSLKMQRNDDPAMKLAFNIARALHKSEGGPFTNQIRFDSRGSLPLPISSICSKGASDIGTSLIGLARIALNVGDANAEQMAKYVNAAFKVLETEHGELLEYGKILTPMASGGTKGSSTMLIGISTCLAYKVLVGKVSLEEALKELSISAKVTLDQATNGSLSGPDKRVYMGKFAKNFLAGMEGEMHEGIPKNILTLLSCSTFSVDALPKAAKAAKSTTETPAEKPVEAKQEEVKVEEPPKESTKKTSKKGEKATTVTVQNPPEPTPTVAVETPAAGKAKKPTKAADKAPAAAKAVEEKAPWEEEILG